MLLLLEVTEVAGRAGSAAHVEVLEDSHTTVHDERAGGGVELIRWCRTRACRLLR